MPKSKLKVTKAYIIGDAVHGLTIVVTNPMMVVRYDSNDLPGNDLDAKRDSVARICHDLITRFRTVDNLDLDERITDLGNHGAGSTTATYNFYDESAALTELGFANTLARKIRQGTTVSDVGVCLAFDIKNPKEFAAGKRRFQPAEYITEYVGTEYGKPGLEPKSPTLGGLPGYDVDPLPKWPGPNAPAKKTVKKRPARKK